MKDAYHLCNVANLAVGEMYLHGKGVKQDLAKAKEWFEKAARGKCALAQYALGRMYLFGEGVEQDLEQARKWFAKSEAGGFLLAKCFDFDIASACVKENKPLKKVFSSIFANDDLLKYDEEAQKDLYGQIIDRILDAFFRHKGSPFRIFEEKLLSSYDAYDLKSLLELDVQEYVKWFKPAAMKGNAQAQYMLGRLYIGADREDPACDQLAQYWLKKAASQGIKEAEKELSELEKYTGYVADYEQCDYDHWLRPLSEYAIYPALSEDLFGLDVQQGQQKLSAKLVMRNAKFVLLKGSNVDACDPSKLKEQLKAEGKLVAKEDGSLELIEDCEFESLLAASTFVVHDFVPEKQIWTIVDRYDFIEAKSMERA